jgi:DNA polymerase elongation subunit (family B)
MCMQGILPTILAALVTARAATREALKALPPAKSSSEAAAAAAVLDSRQKALKLAANALYGFTGESRLSCLPQAVDLHVISICKRGCSTEACRQHLVLLHGCQAMGGLMSLQVPLLACGSTWTCAFSGAAHTGAGASPLQCVPLADSCLAYGAQSCRTAIAEVPKLLAEVGGKLSSTTIQRHCWASLLDVCLVSPIGTCVTSSMIELYHCAVLAVSGPLTLGLLVCCALTDHCRVCLERQGEGHGSSMARYVNVSTAVSIELGAVTQMHQSMFGMLGI